MPKPTAAFVATCALLLPAAAAGGADDPQVRDALARVLARQGTLPDGVKNYDSRSTLTHSAGGGGKPPTHRTVYSSKFSGGNAAVASYDEPPAGAAPPAGQKSSKLLVLNDRYFLAAERNTRNDAWLLKAVQANDGTLDAKNNEAYRILNLFDGKPAFADLRPLQLRVGDTPVSDLTKLSGFSVEPGSLQADDAVVRFTFRYAFTPDDDTTPVASRCAVSFGVGTFGLPTRLAEDSDAGPTDTRHTTTEIDLSQSDKNTYNFSVTRHGENKSNGKTVYKTESTSTGAIKLGKIPDAEFTATAYGLPEPPGFEKPGTPLYVWLLVAAGGLFVASLVLRRAARPRGAAVV